MILLIDNFDSFTFNLVDYLHQLQLKVEVVRNNVSLAELRNTKYDGIVLSPGPGIPEKAGNLLGILKYFHDKLPILGICLGQQAISNFFGATLSKAKKPMHGKISNISHMKDALFDGVPEKFNVTRYHSLVCSNLPRELQAIAFSDIKEVMALKHKELPIHGLQFHPEAVLTEYGLDILRNWKNINSLSD